MNILEQAKDEKFIKGRILDDTKDYGRIQFVDEIYTLLQKNEYLDKVNCHLRKNNEKLKDNWNGLKKWINSEIKNEKHTTHWEVKRKMQELEKENNSNEQEI